MAKNKKSNAVGIIAEYNPFHNGHAYHIRKAKELAQADYCIVAMSGDFVQRGAPAVYDKYTRTAMALSCGADLVLELPSVFATSSAEDFAACGIALLDGLGVTGSVCFGSECGEVEKLSGIASILAMEPPVYTEQLRKELKKGATFPEARNHALIACGILKEEDASVLASPNNILGIEYLKAIYRQKSAMTPVTISRKGSGYHDTILTPGTYSSATGIRKALKENPEARKLADSPLTQVPDPVRQMMEQGYPVFPDDFSTFLNTSLLRLSYEEIPYQRYADVSEELAARLLKQLPDFLPFEEKINSLKTRQYTYTRISRALLHITLGITSDKIMSGRKAGYAPYARVLGFRKASAELMGQIKKRGSIPLITKTADAEFILKGASWSMLRQDFYCSHIYQTIVQDKYQIKMKNEFTHSVVIL
ncbi:nucleotidyltransferase [Clostridium sp. Marseille-P2415]|uniref:nucleotidyltransferase n=1 Tax=Clostridium sp. Marseille-P2415 TaxID=1805471 RepID=UPI0009883761|nr:nucleotidyltransferase [Clostridium sp. Marseille-P2415]